MPISLRQPSCETPQPVVPGARALYFALLDPERSPTVRDTAAEFVRTCLDKAARYPCDLPENPTALADWTDRRAQAVGRHYQTYLAERRAGAPRRYFGGLAHAQHVLRGVAPTKLVDGAWLYGLLGRFRDSRCLGLIRTYLEELGEGDPTKNHVLLYRQLLASQDCENWSTLDDEHFVQGAIQLALAELGADVLPEVIGFNLGYEQLPLHLLITAHELAELGIDPYYFTLHVTVDNAHSGHAHRAAQAVCAAWPPGGEGRDFRHRLRAGYRLNALGADTLTVIAGFDAEREVQRVMREKALTGQYLHSGHCRFEGRTLNQWLAEPAAIPEFLTLLERRGWIRRGRAPAESRFWRLLEGPRAPMFGVFSAAERQLLHDWIAGDPDRASPPPKRFTPLRVLAGRPDTVTPAAAVQDPDERYLLEVLAGLPGRDARLRHLLPLLAPAWHHTPAGLAATRLFNALLLGHARAG